MFPSWVLKYKEPGTTIRKIGNNFYKYKVHSERKPGRKYPVLITDELLGTITKNGFISSKKKLIIPSEIEVKSLYDFANNGLFIEEYGDDDIEILKRIYVMKINDKFYFTKLDSVSKKLLEKHGVNYYDGIFDIDI